MANLRKIGFGFVMVGVSLIALFAATQTGAAAGGGGKTCSYGLYYSAYFWTVDVDQDGFQDAVRGGTTIDRGGAEQVWFNVTLFYPNGSIADQSNAEYSKNVFSTVDAPYNYDLTIDDPNGTYVIFAYEDFVTASCYWQDYSLNLYPAGDYRPEVSAALPIQSADQNSSVTYALTVSNLANNPDTIDLSANSLDGWPVSLSNSSLTLNPGENATVNVTVWTALNAGPLSVHLTNVTANSTRGPGAHASIMLTTTISAQVFMPTLSAASLALSAPPGGTVDYTLTVGNSGNNHDTITFSGTAVLAGWSLTISQPNITLDSGSRGTIRVTVGAPTALTGALSWTASITATAADGFATASLAINTSIALPDFVIGSGDISLSTSTPAVGDPVTVDVTVRNIGSSMAVDIIVRLSDGHTNLTKTVSLGLSGTAFASFTWVAAAGVTEIRAAADATGAIPEANEGNNVGGHAVIVNAPPTAGVSLNGTATAGAAVTISAASSHDPEGAVASYYFDFGDGQNSGWISNSTVTHTYAGPGTYNVNVRVRDASGAESANVTQSVTVSASPSAANPGGFLPGFEAAAAAGAAIVACLIAIRRRR